VIRICHTSRLYLSLSKRDGVEPASGEAFVSSELEQRHGRVGSRRQDEDERSTTVRVHERLGQVERRRLNEVLAEFFSHEVRYSWNNLYTTSELASTYYAAIISINQSFI